MAAQKNISKIAWVTGASTGMGYATALKLAREGWYVAVTARTASRLRAMASSFVGPGQIKAYPGDVTNPDDMKKIVESIEMEWGPIQLALLNAGTYYRDTIENFDVETTRKQFAVNFFGTLNALEPVMACFRARCRGHVAIVASVAGHRGLPYALSYAASKAALINFAESLAIECRGTKIKVQVICPGFVKTPLTEKNDFYMPMLMGVDRAAECIVRGLESSRFEISFPRSFTLALKLINFILPPRAYFALAGLMKAKGDRNAPANVSDESVTRNANQNERAHGSSEEDTRKKEYPPRYISSD